MLKLSSRWFFLTSQKQHLDIIFTFFTWVPARPPPRHRCPKHFDRWDPDTMPTGHGMSRQRKTYRVSRKTQSPTTKPKNSEQHRKTESIGSNQHQSLCLLSVYHLKTHALAGRSFRTRPQGYFKMLQLYIGLHCIHALAIVLIQSCRSNSPPPLPSGWHKNMKTILTVLQREVLSKS